MDVFRVCNTTRMESQFRLRRAVQEVRQEMAFHHPGLCLRHTLFEACRDDLKELGGSVTGNELTPLGTTDFSAYLIKARRPIPT